MRSLDLGPPEGGVFFQHIADAKAYSSMGPPKVAGNLVYHGVGETSSPAENGFVEVHQIPWSDSCPGHLLAMGSLV